MWTLLWLEPPASSLSGDGYGPSWAPTSEKRPVTVIGFSEGARTFQKDKGHWPNRQCLLPSPRFLLLSPVHGGKAIPGTQWQVPGEGPGLAEQPLGRTFAPGLWPALFLAVEAGTGQLTTFSPPVLFWLQIVNSSSEAPPQGSPASACGRIRCFVLLRCAFFFFFFFFFFFVCLSVL